MAYSLYVNNLPPDITIDDLIIYFQSEKSGGGDVDSDATKFDGDTAVVVFEEHQDPRSVLQRQHEIGGHKLEISEKPIKPRPVRNKRTKLQSTPKTEEGIEMSELLFDNKRQSGGGELIKKLERCSPDVANITFLSAEDAADVLNNNSLELKGSRSKVKEKQLELFLPPDRKKLYVENVNPKTTKDGLQYYLEAVTRKDVLDVQFGDNNNALATLDDEPDMRTVQERSGIRPLEGAVLKISNPPVCNSVSITGLGKNTTKQTIELYFEDEKHGGGKIYGDIIYQEDQGKAIASFCNPNVVESLISTEHKLNGSVLSVHQHYQFMEIIKEMAIRKIKLNADIVKHVVKNENEIRDLFGIEVKETVLRSKDELTLPGETDEATFQKFQEYMKTFAAKEVPISKKLLESGKEELDALITTFSKDNLTLAVDEESLCLKLVGNEREIDDVYEQLKTAVGECEKGLIVVTDEQKCPEHKLQLFLLHGIDETLKNDFQVDVTIDLQNERITIKGPQKQVSSAAKSVLTKCAQISERNIDFSENEKASMESGGLDMLNRDLKAKGLKGMVCLSGPNKSKGKILIFDATTFEEVRSFVSDNVHEKTFSLDEDSVTLLKSNEWQEFYDEVTSNTSVKLYTDAKSAEISLVGKKSEVGSTFDKLETFISTRPPQISARRKPGDQFIMTKGNMKISVVVGDLSTYKADVLVNTTGNRLRLDSNPCSKALSIKAGPVLQAECSKIGKIKVGEVAVTPGGNLLCDEVYHIVCVQWNNGRGEQVLRSIIKNCLKKCNTNGKKSIAFPAIGTGLLGFPHDVAAKIFFEETKEFAQRVANCNVNDVSFVVYNQDAKSIQAFEDELKKQPEWGRTASVMTGPFVPNAGLPNTRSTATMGVNERQSLPCENTKKRFLEIQPNAAKKRRKGQKKRQKVEDESIGKISKKQISEITELCETYDVQVTIDKEVNRIILNGRTEDMSTALNEIYRILKKIGEIEKATKIAGLPEDQAEILSQRDKLFYKKPRLIRKVLKGEISVPKYWDPQPHDTNGKELTVHLVSIDPKNPKHKEEYKKVSDHFHLTTISQPIHQIQRIQNPALYKQYAMKKQSLVGKNGSNEKFLFHATGGDKVDAINKHGLNRNYYSGLKGVAFGKGVYFGRDASALSGYAPVCQATNKRYMYYARVAVGDYALGNPSMLVPPRKGGNTNDSYDSTVNNARTPTIFVIFCDDQYYPEYLITFS